MPKPLDEVLASPDDDALIRGVLDHITQRHGDGIDVSTLPEEARVVYVVETVVGIVGNGGFNYLFESSFKGDPGFDLTWAAFEAIGCEAALDAIRKALALFPNNRVPRDLSSRLTIYRSGTGGKRHAVDCKFWDAQGEITKCLARYIRSHRADYAELAIPPPPAKPARRKGPEQVRRKSKRVAIVDFDVLPHWARVALICRCVRRVLPFFSKH